MPSSGKTTTWPELACRVDLTQGRTGRYGPDMQVSITIRGRQYTVRGDDPADAVEAVARDLDHRLEEVASRTRSFDEYTIALLTALNLASELRRLRREMVGRLDELDRDAASVAAVLEAALPADDVRA